MGQSYKGRPPLYKEQLLSRILSRMPSSSIEPISKQITIIVGLTVVGFMAGGLALSFYQNLLFESKLKSMEEENTKIIQTIEEGYRRFDYYRSPQYKDKYAKQNLGLVNPGEKLLIITKNREDLTLPSSPELTLQERHEVEYLELLRQMPIIEHWKLYLFYPDRISTLRNGVN